MLLNIYSIIIDEYNIYRASDIYWVMGILYSQMCMPDRSPAGYNQGSQGAN